MSEAKLSSVLPNNSVIDVMPGKPISTVYANNDNLLKPLELVQYNNDVEMSFPANSFGSTNTFRFPRAYQFLKNISVVFEIKYQDASATSATTIKEDYFAYHMIKEIKYQLGGTEQMTIRGESLLHIAMAQCESQDKKDKLLDIAGTCQGSLAAGDNVGITGVFGTKQYIAMLPLPWCSLESKQINHSQYPLPLHMLNEPLELLITLRPQSECLETITIQSFSAKLNFEYAKIASPNQLKNTVYKYPFISNFSFEYVTPAGTDVSIDLNSFRKGELRGISFTYVDATNYAANRYYSGSRVKKLSLVFNGQIIWSAPKNELYELIYGKTYNILGKRKIVKLAAAASDGEYCTNSTATAANPVVLSSDEDLRDPSAFARVRAIPNGELIIYRGDIVNGTSPPKSEKCYYYIPLSEIKDFSQNFVLGVDASKQTLQLKFTRQDTSAAARVFVTYHYSSCYQFDGDNAILIF